MPGSGQAPPASLTAETYISTPMLGLLVSQALLQDGQTNYALPGSLTLWLHEVGPYLSGVQPEIRLVYRVFRAWLLVYYAPADLLMYGIQI